MDEFPHRGYRFNVSFMFPGVNVQANFQSVSGLSGGYSPEPFVEGGVSAFTHKLTSRSAFTPLTLKRGLTSSRLLYNWCDVTFKTMRTVPTDVLISLLDEKQQPVESWMVLQAIPTNWSASNFDATSSSVVFETLTLNFQNFIRI